MYHLYTRSRERPSTLVRIADVIRYSGDQRVLRIYVHESSAIPVDA